MTPPDRRLVDLARRRLGHVRRSALAIAASVCVAIAAGTLIENLGGNQTSHYALIRALDDGTPRIDRYHQLTGDRVRFHRHWYSPRAPGLALVTLPVYETLEAFAPHATLWDLNNHGRVRDHVGDRKNSKTVWVLGIWGALLPAIAMMLAVAWIGSRIEPGFGTPAAVTLGLGTLVLPFSTVLFAHVLSASLGFAAFALLFRERHYHPAGGLLRCGSAGVCAGYAVTSEYALAAVAVSLALYILAMADRLRRGAAYLCGLVAGLIPLAVYNELAFGSVFHIGYADVPNQQSGFFGIHLPRPGVIVELLLSSHGILTLSPIVGLGGAGTVLLYRRGYRAEALLVAGIAFAFLLYSSGYFLPFGGAVPESRFLVATLPFLCFPLALTYRRWPGPTAALAVASIVMLGIPMITEPLPGGATDLRTWTWQLESGHLTPTVVDVFRIHATQWVAMLPTFAIALLAVSFAVRAAPRLAVDWNAALSGTLLTACWAVFAAVGPNHLGIDRSTASVLTADDPSAHVSGLGHDPLTHIVLYAVLASVTALIALRLVTISRARSISLRR